MGLGVGIAIRSLETRISFELPPRRHNPTIAPTLNITTINRAANGQCGLVEMPTLTENNVGGESNVADGGGVLAIVSEHHSVGVLRDPSAIADGTNSVRPLRFDHGQNVTAKEKEGSRKRSRFGPHGLANLATPYSTTPADPLPMLSSKWKNFLIGKPVPIRQHSVAWRIRHGNLQGTANCRGTAK